MSRVHDALRRAEQTGVIPPPVPRGSLEGMGAPGAAVLDQGPDVRGLLELVKEVPFRVATSPAI